MILTYLSYKFFIYIFKPFFVFLLALCEACTSKRNVGFGRTSFPDELRCMIRVEGRGSPAFGIVNSMRPLASTQTREEMRHMCFLGCQYCEPGASICQRSKAPQDETYRERGVSELSALLSSFFFFQR